MASVGVWMGAEVGGEEEVSGGETPAPLAPLILKGYTEGHCYNTAPDLWIPPSPIRPTSLKPTTVCGSAGPSLIPKVSRPRPSRRTIHPSSHQPEASYVI